MRPFPGSVVSVQPQFQCTHPGWGATLESRQAKAELQFQSTHPGWGATLQKLQIIFINRVSIHAPRTGCDAQRLSGLRDYNKFQSTHPGRGATSMLCVSRSASFSFNPRTPGGVRPSKTKKKMNKNEFQSTHPGRGATLLLNVANRSMIVSIHAPRAGCDKCFRCSFLRVV